MQLTGSQDIILRAGLITGSEVKANLFWWKGRITAGLPPVSRGRQSHHNLGHVATRANPRVHRGLSVLHCHVYLVRVYLPTLAHHARHDVIAAQDDAVDDAGRVLLRLLARAGGGGIRNLISTRLFRGISGSRTAAASPGPVFAWHFEEHDDKVHQGQGSRWLLFCLDSDKLCLGSAVISSNKCTPSSSGGTTAGNKVRRHIPVCFEKFSDAISMVDGILVLGDKPTPTMLVYGAPMLLMSVVARRRIQGAIRSILMDVFSRFSYT
ncbi:hypothetical protein C8R44DRAFT_751277 [Mycena epipterygia]|nr:hypothetical protein C8R44DRAFT_751277 [Mycena epipterygia]